MAPSGPPPASAKPIFARGAPTGGDGKRLAETLLRDWAALRLEDFSATLTPKNCCVLLLADTKKGTSLMPPSGRSNQSAAQQSYLAAQPIDD